MCNMYRCNKITNLNINPNKKCRVKNILSVCSPTLYPPQISVTTELPITGITLKKLVMTAAAQNDISPHGDTYPRKEVAISKSQSMNPTTQVGCIIDLCMTPRKTWITTPINKREDTTTCTARTNTPHPNCRLMQSIRQKIDLASAL